MMKRLLLFENRSSFCLLMVMIVLGLAACSLLPDSPDVDPYATPTPTLAPVSTTAFDLIETLVAPEYLEPEPAVIEPFSDVENCDSYWVRDVVLADATEDDSQVEIDCHLMLSSRNMVTKTLVILKSGVTVDCNGATISGGDGTPNSPNNTNYRHDMIVIRSPSEIVGRERIWTRPRNIIIRDCNILGSIRIWGMAHNGEGDLYAGPDGEDINYYRESSWQEGHTERARANAPTDITLDHLIVTGVGRNPIYFGPGVTNSYFINSRVYGKSDEVALYLDAESSGNTIRNNLFDLDTKDDDDSVLAVDGSSHNLIINNWFTQLDHGGIYLYRNCGQGGVVRHETPSYNRIINNVFYYRVYRGPNPSVFLGSRDGSQSFCDDDDSHDLGSGASNRNYATYNVVMQNQIFVRSVSSMIKTRRPSVNGPNFIDYNHTVTEDTVIRNGPAGCYLPGGYRDFVPHGTVIDVYRGSDDIPICTGLQDTCNDGELVRSANSTCELTTASFDCRITDNNDGCLKTAFCPNNRRIVAARAACNLEWGTISDASLAAIPGNVMQVLRASDAVSSGECQIGGNRIREGSTQIDDLVGSFAVSVSCHEYDVNGGDCQIRGELFCR